MMKVNGLGLGSAKRGFTLIELMIVVAIIGILAAVAIPKFADLINKSKEGATKGSLGAVRGALSVYYGDLEGRYPGDTLGSLTTSGKYIQSIPAAKTPQHHSDSATVKASSGTLMFTDAGGWAYNNTESASEWGSFWVNCTHTDTKGNVWTTY